MKKFSIIFVVFSIILICSARADIRLGLKAGVNLANPSFNINTLQTSNFTGYQAGPIVELMLSGVGIDAAVLYSQQGLKFKFNDMDFDERQSTLDVPVNLKFKFGLLSDFKAFLTAGPYASFMLSGDKFSISNIKDNIKDEIKNESFGAGINLGCGLELFKHLQVGVNYKIGVTDDYKRLRESTSTEDLKGKTRVWSVTATYFF